MALQFTRLFATEQVKSIGDKSLCRLGEHTPTSGVSYGAWEDINVLTCYGVAPPTQIAGKVVIAHVSAGMLVTKIYDDAFSGQRHLTSVIVPDTIVIIGKYAFADCELLSSVIFLGTIAQWNSIVKDDTLFMGSMSVTCVHCSDGDVPVTPVAMVMEISEEIEIADEPV